MREIDFGEYIRAPRIGMVSGVVLTVRLIRAAHGKPIPAHVLKFLGVVHEKAERVQAAARGQQVQAGGAKYQDQRFDAAWGGVYRRIQSFAKMVGEPEQPKAKSLLENLFPDGLTFVLMGHDAEWVHSRNLLARIEDEGHTELIEELSGARFLKLVKQTHAELGEALGLDTEPQPSEPTLSLGKEIRGLALAIADYARIFAGTVIDEQSLELFEAALQPLADHRARQRKSAGPAGGEGEGEVLEGEAEYDAPDVDIDEPLPPVPEGT